MLTPSARVGGGAFLLLPHGSLALNTGNKTGVQIQEVSSLPPSPPRQCLHQSHGGLARLLLLTLEGSQEGVPPESSETTPRGGRGDLKALRKSLGG